MIISSKSLSFGQEQNNFKVKLISLNSECNKKLSFLKQLSVVCRFQRSISQIYVVMNRVGAHTQTYDAILKVPVNGSFDTNLFYRKRAHI